MRIYFVDFVKYIYRYFRTYNTKLIASVARSMIFVIRLRDTAILILIVMLHSFVILIRPTDHLDDSILTLILATD